MLKNLASIYLFTVISLIVSQNIVGQTLFISKNQNDKLQHIDSVLIITHDTIYFYKVTFDSIDNDAFVNFYVKLKNQADRSLLTRELFNMVFRKPKQKQNFENIEIEQSESRFTEFNGKIIRNIYLRKLDPFGTEIDAPIFSAQSLFAEAANRIHIKTRNEAIRNNLIFAEGDTVNSNSLAENEKILRDLIYIKDALIEIYPANSDSVDILVITKDVWSYAIDGKYYNNDSVSVKLIGRNVFGTGQNIQNDILINVKDKTPVGYSGSYQLENLFGTFINTNLVYTDAFGTENYALYLKRDFLSHQFKYAGGISVQQIKTNISDESFNNQNIKYNFLDCWFGRKFSITSKFDELIWINRFNTHKYLKLPDENLNLKLNNYSQVLSSVALARRNYYKGNRIYFFNQTEDIPYGYLFQMIEAYEFSENAHSLYSGCKLAAGNYFGKNYFFSSLEVGSYLNKSSFENGVIAFKLNTFSKLIHLKTFEMRYFIRSSYTSGIHRNDYQQLSLSDEYDVHGLKLDSLKGSYKWTYNFEEVIYSRRNFFGFESAAFLFQDLSVLGNKQNFVFNNQWFKGFGIGIRISNENLFFRTLEFRFAYFPENPQHAGNYIFWVSGMNLFRLDDFIPLKPQIVEMK